MGMMSDRSWNAYERHGRGYVVLEGNGSLRHDYSGCQIGRGPPIPIWRSLNLNPRTRIDPCLHALAANERM